MATAPQAHRKRKNKKNKKKSKWTERHKFKPSIKFESGSISNVGTMNAGNIYNEFGDIVHPSKPPETHRPKSSSFRRHRNKSPYHHHQSHHRNKRINPRRFCYQSDTGYSSNGSISSNARSYSRGSSIRSHAPSPPAQHVSTTSGPNCNLYQNQVNTNNTESTNDTSTTSSMKEEQQTN